MKQHHWVIEDEWENDAKFPSEILYDFPMLLGNTRLELALRLAPFLMESAKKPQTVPNVVFQIQYNVFQQGKNGFVWLGSTPNFMTNLHNTQVAAFQVSHSSTLELPAGPFHLSAQIDPFQWCSQTTP